MLKTSLYLMKYLQNLSYLLKNDDFYFDLNLNLILN